MTGYFYTAIVAILLCCNIIRSIYQFNKGEYNPYSYRKEKGDFSFIISFGILIGGFVFLRSVKLLYIATVIFLCYSFCLIICESVLNYLSYRRIKDTKIVFQTALFDIMIIIISAGIWTYVTKSI